MSKERPPIFVQRRGSFLIPQAPIDGELLEGFPSGKPLRVAITQPRSVPQLRLYWSMLRLVADNMETEVTTEALHSWVKMRCGVAAAIPLKSGAVDYVPGSVAFDRMSQDEFARFFDRAVTLIVEHLLPGLGKASLVQEARIMLGEAA